MLSAECWNVHPYIHPSSYLSMLYVKVDRESCPACMYRTATFFFGFRNFRIFFLDFMVNVLMCVCALEWCLPASIVSSQVLKIMCSHQSVSCVLENCAFEYCRALNCRHWCGPREWCFESCLALENWFPFESRFRVSGHLRISGVASNRLVL